MNSNQKTRFSDVLSELSAYKKSLLESQFEYKTLSKDYIDLVKKCNVILKENESLKKENERLRVIVYERKNNS